MKTLSLIVTTIVLAAGTMFAQNGNGSKGPAKESRQQGPRAGAGNGQRTGPQDGTGPIHEPGTGGGGAGVGNGRRTGPQDGSGPIHQPGTGGGNGGGLRRGRK